MRRPRTALLGTLAVVPLVVGCGAGGSGGADGGRATGGTTTSPTPLPPVSPAPPALPSATSGQATVPPPFSESTDRRSGPGSGGSELVLVDVRVAQAEGFDRIVLEFSGAGTPGWVVGYVDEAVLDGSGEVVALDGTAVLDIYATGTTWPAPDYYSGPSRLTPRGSGVVDDVFVGGTVEGYTQVLAGVDGDRAPFRVFALTAPARLVIDVRPD